MNDDFDLGDFLPYLLNRAAEETSLGFRPAYRDRHGMLRTEWRVLFHLGRHGTLTARDICDSARLHKTKVSRAVKALETKRFLVRATSEVDRREEPLSLTRRGRTVYAELAAAAQRYDADMISLFSAREARTLKRCLQRLAARRGV